MSKKKFENVNCLICKDDTKVEEIATRGQFNLECHTSICTICGLVFLTPRWTKPEYQNFYSIEYDSYYRPDEISNNKPSEKHLKQYNLILLRIGSYFKPFTTVLDIGCGYGWVMHYINQKYPIKNMYAIESSDRAREFLKNKNIDILTHDVDENWDQDNQNKFELIISRHTLEHFLDPISIITKISHSLTEDGLCYIAVPDMMNPTGDLIDKFFRVVHTYYFNEQTLETVLLAGGIKCIEKGSDNGETWILGKKTKPQFMRCNNYKPQNNLIQKRLNERKKKPLKHNIKQLIKKIINPLI